MNHRMHRVLTHACLCFATLGSFAQAAGQAGPLEEMFRTPPSATKPLTWWHWVDGNVTRDGITRDLESMKRVGLQGCYLFSIGGFFNEGAVKFMDPSYLGMLDHAIAEAARLDLKFGIHNCDGWSESGGPWITAENSMKVLTHSAIEVDGNTLVKQTLAVPAHRLDFYRDIAVLAFPRPDGERINGADSGVELSGSIPPAALQRLIDGEPATIAKMPAAGDHSNTIGFVFKNPQTVRSLAFHRPAPCVIETDFPVRLEVAEDGTNYHTTGTFSINWATTESNLPVTVAVTPVTARHFRLVFQNPWPITLGEIELSTAAKLHYAEGKAGRIRQGGHGGETLCYDNTPGPDRQQLVPSKFLIDPSSVLNITPMMDSNGQLTWNAPPGKWRILRVGYTTSGRTNKPATRAGTGLECDKLDPRAVRFHLDQYVGKLADRFGPETGRTFAAVETDSWECDIQNWTAGLDQRFSKAIGYDILPRLPLLLEGWLVGSYDSSERMLWDWRRFLADQLAASYFEEVAKYAKARNLTYVVEGAGRQMYLYDPIGYQRAGEVPMGEFWIGNGSGGGLRVDNKAAASAAHLGGRRYVAAEAYTSGAAEARWQNHPYSMKALGDSAYCAGVNQFVFHTFAHQPFETPGPGFTMAQWGVMANRKNTWWEPGTAWITYLSRCNAMLQEGRFHADVLAFIGEDVPNRVAWRTDLKPALPPGYDFDACDARALLEATVRSGKIVIPSGMEYAVLLMPARTAVRPEVLEKARDLARAGATVVIPEVFRQSPSLRDVGGGDVRVREVVGELTGIGASENRLGLGRVFTGMAFEQVFQKTGLTPDFDCGGAPDVGYVHRLIGEADVYFVSNQRATAQTITAHFRISGRQPEIWDPVTGKITRPGGWKVDATGIELPLRMDPVGSCFVVFRSPMPDVYATSITPASAEVLERPDGGWFVRTQTAGNHEVRFSDGSTRKISATLPASARIPGPWSVEFPPGLGAPPRIELKEPASWTEHPDTGVRYFSGTAIYRTTFMIDSPCPDRLLLDLGDVQVMADVMVNGHPFGVLWKPPFRVDIGSAIKPGQNTMELRVTNLWPNRMIGDEQFPDEVTWMKQKPYPETWPEWVTGKAARSSPRISFTTRRTYQKGDPLLPSGLLGPVQLIPETCVALPLETNASQRDGHFKNDTEQIANANTHSQRQQRPCPECARFSAPLPLAPLPSTPGRFGKASLPRMRLIPETCVALPLETDAVEANRMTEVSFTSTKAYEDPFNEVTLDVVFSTPDRKCLRVPAFWAGGNTWRVRYASGLTGTHLYRTVCSDTKNPALHDITGEVKVIPYTGDNPLFVHGPVRIADDRRHFAYADGTPFFWLGDTWWMGLTKRLTWPGDFQQLATNRRDKGFTVIQIVAGLLPDMPAFDERGAGDAGFPWEPDYKRIRPEYFDAADQRIRHLIDQGMTPCILASWGYHLQWLGTEKMKQHWRYIIARWGALPVVWCASGEQAMPWYLSSNKVAETQQLRSGWTDVSRTIRETDPFKRLVTTHPRSNARDEVLDATLLDFEMQQTGHGSPTDHHAAMAIQAWKRPPIMPVICGESRYEALEIKPMLHAREAREAFWAHLLNSGCAGHTYGVNGVWQVNLTEKPFGTSPNGRNWGSTPWQTAMNLPGSTQLSHAKKFLLTLPWQHLAPSSDVFTGATSAAATADAKCALAYAAKGQVIAADLGKLDAPVAARWFDPTKGVLLDVEGSPLSNKGRHEFTPPGKNADGDADWVLVLEAE